MTDLSLNHPNEYAPVNEQAAAIVNPIPAIVQAIFPTKTEAAPQASYMDAWLLSSNGQG